MLLLSFCIKAVAVAATITIDAATTIIDRVVAPPLQQRVSLGLQFRALESKADFRLHSPALDRIRFHAATS